MLCTTSTLAHRPARVFSNTGLPPVINSTRTTTFFAKYGNSETFSCASCIDHVGH
jgi:hypothetical protein